MPQVYTSRINCALPFPDRRDAGRALAALLRNVKGVRNTIILALVRGGVAVGRALADALCLPLYPYVVRKIGHPGHREYAMGAIAEGGSTFLDDGIMQEAGVTWADMEPVIEEELTEMNRRKVAYEVGARPPLTGRHVILTDDGAATGSTMLAAIDDVRKAGAKKVTVALPVCPPDTVAMLEGKADAVIVCASPVPFDAVGKWYVDFPQLSDDDVIKLLTTEASPKRSRST